MRFSIFCVGLALLGSLLGCKPSGAKTKGAPPKGNPVSMLAIKAGDTPQTVVIHGILIEKCPVAGCWFRLQDDTDVIKVDTKAAGFVVTEIPLRTQITVGGKVALEGREMILRATGLKY